MTRRPQVITSCVECGKALVKKPTLVQTPMTHIIFLCYDCYEKLKKKDAKNESR
jgi:hypothetical protein